MYNLASSEYQRIKYQIENRKNKECVVTSSPSHHPLTLKKPQIEHTEFYLFAEDETIKRMSPKVMSKSLFSRHKITKNSTKL